MKKCYNIIEIANVHAGNFEYLKKLVAEYKSINGIDGIKFQPFKFDKIALPDFPWFDVYKKLYFTEKQWTEIINESNQTWDIWIDTFDEYSLNIISQNLANIKGLKFQSSILYNKRLIKELGKINLNNQSVILNISGIEEKEIAKIIQNFETILKPKEIILQVGFQGYPTEMTDNGLNKIGVLKSVYQNKIAFADHVDANLPESKLLPIMAVMHGADVIEKHIKLSGSTPEYDHYSSMDADAYKEYLRLLNTYYPILDQAFINDKEKHYLNTTIQIPTLNKDKEAYTNLNLEEDFEYKRTAQHGLRTNELEQRLSDFYILGNKKHAGEVIKKEDLKKANIGVIIACRLKSSRLPKKALLKIGDLSSVEFCIQHALNFQSISHTILATSNLEEDGELIDYCYSPQVVFHKGHPLDVIQRYLDIIETLRLDVIVRVTADMPYISDEILQPILKSHFQTGADYSRAKKAAIGTNLEVINVEALKRVKQHFPQADFSEYMTYYFTNNPSHFKINEIDLGSELVRDYRLTLDYEEDLILFNKIEEYLKSKNQDSSLKNVFEFLDNNPEIAKINLGMEVKYFTDKTLIDKINANTTIKL